MFYYFDHKRKRFVLEFLKIMVSHPTLLTVIHVFCIMFFSTDTKLRSTEANFFHNVAEVYNENAAITTMNLKHVSYSGGLGYLIGMF